MNTRATSEYSASKKNIDQFLVRRMGGNLKAMNDTKDQGGHSDSFRINLVTFSLEMSPFYLKGSNEKKVFKRTIYICSHKKRQILASRLVFAFNFRSLNRKFVLSIAIRL